MKHALVASLGLAVSVLILGPVPVCEAQGKGDGGIVLRDAAPVYRGSTGDKVEATLNRGDAVAGITTEGIFGDKFQFEEEDGRIHVLYFRSHDKEGGPFFTAWVNPADLARFTYDCGCDRESKPNCRPTSSRWMKFRWNTCFLEARDAKLAQLTPTWGQEPAGTAAAAGASAPPPQSASQGSQVPAERPLTNADVIALVKLELGDDLVISKIQQAPVEALDVSTDALIKLKGEGVSKAVLDAMIKRAAQRKQ